MDCRCGTWVIQHRVCLAENRGIDPARRAWQVSERSYGTTGPVPMGPAPGREYSSLQRVPFFYALMEEAR